MLNLSSGEVDMLFDILLTGLFKAVRVERNLFHRLSFYLENKLGEMLSTEQ